MTDDQNIDAQGSAHAALDGTPTAQVAAKKRPSSTITLISCGVVVVVMVLLVAVLRPMKPAVDPHLPDSAGESEAPEPEVSGADASPRSAATDGAASRPAAGTSIAMLVQADQAYDAGDFGRARELYLDLLLSGGDFAEGGDAVVNWTHARLALALARVARASNASLLDEPPLLFRDEGR